MDLRATWRTNPGCNRKLVVRDQSRVVRKSVNANPGLKVNRTIIFSCLKVFFTAYVMGSLGLFKLKTEG